MRRGSFLACAAIVFFAAPADARVLRDDAAQMTIDVSFPDAKTCIVHPASMRDAACDGVDVARYPAPSARTTIVALAFADHVVTVQVTVNENMYGRAWTNEEATKFTDVAMASTKSMFPDAQWVDETTRVTVGDLQTHRRTLRLPSRALRDEIDLIEGRDALIVLHTTYAEARENVGISIAQSVLRSISLPAAPPLRAEIATTALRMLAGVPVVALLALFAARKKKEPAS